MDLKRKHNKIINSERNSSAVLQMKLHTKHEKQLNDVQKCRQDLCNKCDKKVDTERGSSTRMTKENNKLRTVVAADTTAKAGNKCGLETIKNLA